VDFLGVFFGFFGWAFYCQPLPGGGGEGRGGWEAGAGCAPAGGHRAPPLPTARSRGGTAGCASIAVILRYETPTKHLVSFFIDMSVCIPSEGSLRYL
jgi:hypothetical protein